MSESLLLKPDEACAALHIGRTHLYDLLRQGLIESVKIGGARRIPRDALERYVNDLRGVS